MADEHPMTVDTVTAFLERTHTQRDTTQTAWTWHVTPTQHAGWYSAQFRGPGELDFLIGGRTFVGPGHTLLTVSSNPRIHDHTIVDNVIAEHAGKTVNPDTLLAEIFERTRNLH